MAYCTPLRFLSRLFGTGAAALALAGVGSSGSAQEASDPHLPDAAKLALRAAPGDMVRIAGDRKLTAHVHIEAIGFELTTESIAKDQESLAFKGRTPEGALLFDLRQNSKIVSTANLGQTASQTISRNLRCTIKPSMDVAKAVPIGAQSTTRRKTATGSVSGDLTPVAFSNIRFPDRPLKTGDTWSGTVVIRDQSELNGIHLAYTASVVGFEMYQSFETAHVEVQYAYKGGLPALDSQIRKSLPKGAALKGDAELTGTETVYFALDRGWPLSDEVKLNVILNFVMSQADKQIEFGGTLDAEIHSAVVAAPPFSPAMVPAVAGSSPN